MEDAQLAFRAIVESSYGGRYSGDEFGEAGRSGDVAFAVGDAVLGWQIAGEGGKDGGIDVAQAIEQRG